MKTTTNTVTIVTEWHNGHNWQNYTREEVPTETAQWRAANYESWGADTEHDSTDGSEAYCWRDEHNLNQYRRTVFYWQGYPYQPAAETQAAE